MKNDKKTKVFLSEDNKGIQDIVRWIVVTEMNCDLLVFEETQEVETVCNMIQADGIRVLICDKDCPHQDSGMHFALSMRECFPDLTIILISGSVQMGSGALVHAIAEENGILFLSKPFCPEDLRDAVESALKGEF